MKNGKTPGLSGAVPESLKAAEEGVVDRITDLVNQIIAEDIIPVEWDISRTYQNPAILGFQKEETVGDLN